MKQTAEHRNRPEQGPKAIVARIVMPNPFDHPLHQLPLFGRTPGTGMILKPPRDGFTGLSLKALHPALDSAPIDAELFGDHAHTLPGMQREQGLRSPHLTAIGTVARYRPQRVAGGRNQMESCHVSGTPCAPRIYQRRQLRHYLWTPT